LLRNFPLYDIPQILWSIQLFIDFKLFPDWTIINKHLFTSHCAGISFVSHRKIRKSRMMKSHGKYILSHSSPIAYFCFALFFLLCFILDSLYCCLWVFSSEVCDNCQFYSVILYLRQCNFHQCESLLYLHVWTCLFLH
jgi:hypothetical protein